MVNRVQSLTCGATYDFLIVLYIKSFEGMNFCHIVLFTCAVIIDVHHLILTIRAHSLYQELLTDHLEQELCCDVQSNA